MAIPTSNLRCGISELLIYFRSVESWLVDRFVTRWQYCLHDLREVGRNITCLEIMGQEMGIVMNLSCYARSVVF